MHIIYFLTYIFIIIIIVITTTNHMLVWQQQCCNLMMAVHDTELQSTCQHVSTTE